MKTQLWNYLFIVALFCLIGGPGPDRLGANSGEEEAIISNSVVKKAPKVELDQTPAATKEIVSLPSSDDEEKEKLNAKATITKRDGSPLPKEAPYGVSVGFSVKNNKSHFGMREVDGKPIAAVKWAVEIKPESPFLREWIEVIDNGASISVPTGDSRYGVRSIRVTAAVAAMDTIDMQEIEIFVKDPLLPNPPPNPGPDVDPDEPDEPDTPDTPDPFEKLTKDQKDIYKAVVNNVTMTNRRREIAGKAAELFGDIATKISGAVAGDPELADYKNQAFIFKETTRRHQDIYSPDEEWKKVFAEGGEMAKILERRVPRGASAGEHIPVWNDMKEAFKAISQSKGQ